MKRLLGTLLFTILLTGTAFASVAGITEFKAVIVECEDGVKTESKVWITNDKSRREFDNGREIIVTRNDMKVTWFVYPRIKCYVETPVYGTFANFTQPDEHADTGDLQRKFLQYEDRDSYRMKKYLVTVKYRMFNTEDKYYEWTRNDFPVPVRTESLDGKNWTEYTKISRGPIDYTLFERPKTYKKVSAEDAEKFIAEYDAAHPADNKTVKTKAQKKKSGKAATNSSAVDESELLKITFPNSVK